MMKPPNSHNFCSPQTGVIPEAPIARAAGSFRREARRAVHQLLARDQINNAKNRCGKGQVGWTVGIFKGSM